MRYAANVAAVSSMEVVLYLVAVRERLLKEAPTPVRVRTKVIDQLVAPVVLLVSIPVALAGAPGLARYLWISLVVPGPLVGRRTRAFLAAEGADSPVSR